MFGARLGHFLDRPLEPFARRIRIAPNVITLVGFAVTVMGSVVMMRNLRFGGLVIAIGSIMDILDGVVARTQGRETNFGAFLDSVLDRYADAAIFLGLAWYLGAHGNHIGVLLSLGTLVGAFVISYAKARAEGLDIKCDTGLMERPERIVMLVFGAVSGWIMPIIWIMFFLTHFTAFQRVNHVRKSTRKL